MPTRADATNRGTTGRPARVVLGARREQVLELFSRYLRALQNRSIDEMRPLFDDSLVGIEGADPVPREQVLVFHERLMQIIDTSQLVEALSGERPSIRSASDLRREGRSPPLAMRPTDWLVVRPQFSRAAVPSAGHYVNYIPRQFLVRWVGDRPLIVGLSDNLVRGRP